jgi:hypothetical protein
VLFHHFERFVAEYERFAKAYGVVAVIQTFGDRINFHPHLHFLVTEGGVDEAGVFQRMSLICPKCGGTMKVVAFITEYAAVDRIIDHLKLTFVAEKPPPSHVIEQVALTRPPREGLRNAALMAAEERVEVLFLVLDIDPRQGLPSICEGKC